LINVKREELRAGASRRDLMSVLGLPHLRGIRAVLTLFFSQSGLCTTTGVAAE
jgi:hypothetical protein